MKEAGESSKEMPSGSCEKVKVVGRAIRLSFLLKAQRPPEADCRARPGWAAGEKTNPTSEQAAQASGRSCRPWPKRNEPSE